MRCCPAPCCSLPCCQSYKMRCSGWEWNRMGFSCNLQAVWSSGLGTAALSQSDQLSLSLLLYLFVHLSPKVTHWQIRTRSVGLLLVPRQALGPEEGHWWGRKLKQEGTVLAFRSSSWLCTNCIWLDISAVVHPETHSFDLMLCYESVFLCFPWGLLTPSS